MHLLYLKTIQDKEASDVRTKLLSQLEKDGITIKRNANNDRPSSGFLSFDGKVSIQCIHRIYTCCTVHALQ
jgi:hypothetical protein